MREPPISKRRLCPPEAAKRLRLLAKQGCRPKRIIADKLGSAAAARKAIMPNVEHRSHKAPNNRAENSHVPLRKRARQMQGFRSWPALQRFAETLSTVRDLFVPPRSRHPSPSPQGGRGICGGPRSVKAAETGQPPRFTLTRRHRWKAINGQRKAARGGAFDSGFRERPCSLEPLHFRGIDRRRTSRVVQFPGEAQSRCVGTRDRSHTDR